MRRAWLLGCVCLAGVGCRKERWLPSTRQESATAEADAARGPGLGRGGGPLGGPSAGEALGVLAAKRCERATRCGRVGPGKAFLDEDQCLAAARLALQSQRYLQRCAAGLDGAALETCAQALAGVPCGADERPLGEIDACRLGQLCTGEQ